MLLKVKDFINQHMVLTTLVALVAIFAVSYPFMQPPTPESVRAERCTRDFPGTFPDTEGRGGPICKYPDSTFWRQHWEYAPTK